MDKYIFTKSDPTTNYYIPANKIILPDNQARTISDYIKDLEKRMHMRNRRNRSYAWRHSKPTMRR